jgi:hypothetical protein
MSPEVTTTLSKLGEKIVRSASEGNSEALSRYLDEQRRFVDIHGQSMDQATITELQTTLEKALLSAKIHRSGILQAIQANHRSLGILQAYQIAASL